MALLEILAAKSFNQGAMLNRLFDFLLEGEKHMVLLTFLELHLSLKVLLVKELDTLDNSNSILLPEVLSVPLRVLLVEVIAVSAQFVTLLKALLEDFDFGDLYARFDLKHFFVLLVLLDLGRLDLELTANLGELS